MGLRFGSTFDGWTRPSSRMNPSSWIAAAVLAIVCVALTRAFLLQTFRIPSSSMMPTLLVGDHILVNKMVFGFPFLSGTNRFFAVSSPKRGDVVVFYRFSELEELDFNTHYIKRVVAVPGDEVKVVNFKTYVNGEPVRQYDAELSASPEPATDLAGRDYGPVRLEAGRYWVLGDNQGNSRDSRYYGPIHIADIEGRASFIYWSWDMRTSPAKVRWDRVGKIVR